MAVCIYTRGAQRLMAGALAGAGGALDLRMAIVTGNATGLIDRTLNTIADVDGLNAGATNIHTERIALTGEAATEDDANFRSNVDSGDVAFAAAAGVTAVGCVIYIEAGTDATRDLVYGCTTSFPQPMDGGLTVTVTDFLRAVAQTA